MLMHVKKIYIIYKKCSAFWQFVASRDCKASDSLSSTCPMAEYARGNFNAYLISISSKSSARQLRNDGVREWSGGVTRGVAGRVSVTVC